MNQASSDSQHAAKNLTETMEQMRKDHALELECIKTGNLAKVADINKKLKKKTEMFIALQQEFEDLQATTSQKHDLLEIIARLENKFEQLSAIYSTTLSNQERLDWDIHERD